MWYFSCIIIGFIAGFFFNQYFEVIKSKVKGVIK